MKANDLVTGAVLLAVGTILHMIAPPLFFGVKPDFLLAMMFVAILINPNIKYALAVGVVAGILAAITTGMPGGQIPSLFDKVGSALVVYAIGRFISVGFESKIGVFIKSGLAGLFGTFISGVIFLLGVMLIAGLPSGTSFGNLIYIVVLPTALTNAALVIVLNRILSSFIFLKRH